MIGKMGEKKKKVQFPLEQPKSTRKEEEKQEGEKLGNTWTRQEPEEEEGATLEWMEWEKNTGTSLELPPGRCQSNQLLIIP